jgi:hypothetical protein
MPVIFEIPHIPRSPSPVSPSDGARNPNYKALLIGMNYSWPSGSAVSEQGDPSRPTPLGGPVRDVEEIKSTLMGAAR